MLQSSTIFLAIVALLNVAHATPAEVRKALYDFGLTVDTAAEFAPALCIPDEEFADSPYPRPKLVRSLDKETARRIVSILLDRYSYAPDMMKACGFNTDAILNLSHNGTSCYIHFCFSCAEVAILDSNYDLLAIADIDRGRNELAEIFKEVYPDSERAQKLALSGRTYTIQDAIDWAALMIPDDPLLQRLKALRLEEVSDQDAEEVAHRATALMKAEQGAAANP